MSVIDVSERRVGVDGDEKAAQQVFWQSYGPWRAEIMLIPAPRTDLQFDQLRAVRMSLATIRLDTDVSDKRFCCCPRTHNHLAVG